MGLNITYKAGKDSLTFRLSQVDIDISRVLAEKGFEKEVDALIDVYDFGVETPVETRKLTQSVNVLVEAIMNNPELLPYTYHYSEKVLPGSGIYSKGSGVTSGVLIQGEPYCIEAGLDICQLTRMYKEDGVWKKDKPKDVKNLKEIVTENIGVIEIKREKKRTQLIRNLKKLRNFVKNSEVDVIQKILG